MSCQFIYSQGLAGGLRRARRGTTTSSTARSPAPRPTTPTPTPFLFDGSTNEGYSDATQISAATASNLAHMRALGTGYNRPARGHFAWPISMVDADRPPGVGGRRPDLVRRHPVGLNLRADGRTSAESRDEFTGGIEVAAATGDGGGRPQLAGGPGCRGHGHVPGERGRSPGHPARVHRCRLVAGDAVVAALGQPQRAHPHRHLLRLLRVPAVRHRRDHHLPGWARGGLQRRPATTASTSRRSPASTSWYGVTRTGGTQTRSSAVTATGTAPGYLHLHASPAPPSASAGDPSTTTPARASPPTYGGRADPVLRRPQHGGHGQDRQRGRLPAPPLRTRPMTGPMDDWPFLLLEGVVP